jgi:hypothetical protein
MAEAEQKAESIWWKLGAVILSVVALVVAMRSCAISKQALSLTQTSFVTTSRPYLLVSPYKPEEWDAFLKCTSVDAGTDVALAFRIKNAGSTPAHNTRVDEANVDMHFTSKQTGADITDRTRLDLQLAQPDGLTIGPNEKYQMEAHMVVHDIGDQTARMQDLLDRGAKLPVEIQVSYDAVLGDRTTRHTSITKAMLYKDRAEVLASEVK